MNAQPGAGDRKIGDSRTQIWVIPTNEELLIALDTVRCISSETFNTSVTTMP
jgi:acetate kinase